MARDDQRVRLADGGEAELRILRPEDREAFLRFHAELSPETRHWRYFTTRPELPEHEVEHFTHPDPRRALSRVAWIGDEIVGHACYDLAEPGAAETAFEVADAHQGRGLGTALFEALAVDARAHGIRRFLATVMLGNRRMLEMFRNLGFTERTHRESTLVKVEIDLDQTDAYRRAADERRRQSADAAEERRRAADAEERVSVERDDGSPRSRLRRVLLVAAVPLLACVATPSQEATAPASAPAALVDAGRRDYQDHCAVCHGIDGRGQGPAATALRVAPADLTRIAARRGGAFPELEIAYRIDGRFEITSHGPREMPIWGTQLRQKLPQDETGEAIVRGRIEAIVAYLSTLQR